MKFVKCTQAEHGVAILEILNHAIVNSTAIYDYKPRSAESMRAWFDAKKKCNFPVIGAFDENCKLLGFASYGTFRSWPAYKYTVEHSVYVHHEHQGQGIGKELLRQIISQATNQGYHVLVGGIDANNHASIRLHKKLGFTHSGTVQQAGFKFGKWLDLAFYQLILSTPKNPKDG